MAKPIYVLNGPNLNLLGTREVTIYGSDTLSAIKEKCEAEAKRLGHAIEFRQSNHEGDLVDWIQEGREQSCGIIINGGAYSHTSIAIHDALRLCAVPVIEVHLSNPYAREAFRHHSMIAPVAKGLICGLGATGYILAISAAAQLVAAGGAK
jgi:3-dehydroquinate dehydratase-2